MYKAKEIAKYIVCLAQENGDIITNLKLQKLLYYAQAWFLVNNGNKRLFKDDIQAWQYGPVVPDVYNEYQQFGRKPIEIDCNIEKDFNNICDEVKEYLNEFCNEFLRFSATELVGMTHQETPWIEATKKGFYSVIDTDSMYEYYSGLVNDEEK